MDDAEWEALEKQRRSDKKGERPWLVKLGFVTRLVVYGGLFLTLYLVWPDLKKWSQPLSNITVWEIIGPIAWIGLTLLLIKYVFEPDDDVFVRELWGWLGVALITGGVLYAVFS